jgi:predicted transcriptional regulator
MFIYNKNIYKEGGIIIKQSAVKVLDEKDLEFIDALRSLNVPRNVATLITFLANMDEASSSREIEKATALSQPEVSIGMRTLRNNNWLAEPEIKVEGKGRPTKVYTLSVPFEEIIRHYEEEKNGEAARTMQAIQRLKELSSA